ncbi:MAG: hypothetical protein OWS74_07325 [Firmicutes bacterium]|nr:hypothetical protein [Bacillota bacterium]
MSQEGEIIKPKELSQEKIAKLLKDAMSKEEEAKYLLEVERYTRGDLFDRFNVVYGDADVVTVDKQSEKATDLVIPKTDIVIVVIETVSSYTEYDGQTQIYVFVGNKGWIKVK